MEPIPESVEAAGELDPVGTDDSLLERLLEASGHAQVLVPDLVGVSLAVLRRGLAFTVVATHAELAALDAVQYLASGPCVNEIERLQEPRRYTDGDVLDEARWQTFSEATAARAVRSTLTLPVLDEEGVTTGSVNMYAASRHSFEGHHDELAALFGAWAPGAVRNADLGFSTRERAVEAPRRVREELRIETAVGILAAQLGVDEAGARAKLRDAAVRAGVGVLAVAEVLLEIDRGTD